MTPTVGRIVHYVAQDGQHLAAMVTGAGGEAGEVHLTVFLDWRASPYGFAPTYLERRESVYPDEDAKAPGTWHWPEREA